MMGGEEWSDMGRGLQCLFTAAASDIKVLCADRWAYATDREVRTRHNLQVLFLTVRAVTAAQSLREIVVGLLLATHLLNFGRASQSAGIMSDIRRLRHLKSGLILIQVAGLEN